MAKKVIFLCFLKISLVICRVFYQQNSLHGYGESINPIISFFKNCGFNSIKLNVANSNNNEALDIATKIIQENNLVTILMKVSSNGVTPTNNKSPTILILESASELSMIELLISSEYSKYFLVVVTKQIFPNITEVLKMFRKYLMLDVNFLMKKGHQFLLFTFFPFSNGKCGEDFNLKLISSFSDGIWSDKRFYPQKVNDLKRCEIKIGVNPSLPFTMVEINNQTNLKSFDGIEVETIRTLGNEFNFNPTFDGPFPVIGTVYNNGSSTGLLSLVHEKKVDVVIGTLSLQLERLKFLSGTTFYMSDSSILTMPQTTTISPFEKLHMPFDIIIWSLIITMYIVGILIVTLTRLVSKTVYEFVVGRKVSHPILNMLIAFLGTTQKLLPQSTFSRFLLAKFLIFCLVMRGLYQGKLFDIMHREIFEKEAKTFDELIERNFYFYAYESLSRRVEGFKFAHRMIVIPFADIEKYQRKTLDTSFKGAVFSYEAQVLYKNFINRKSFSYIICEERLVNNQLVFYLQRNHYLAEQFSEKIEWFREFGITNHIISKYVDPDFRKKSKESDEKDALNFHELSATFGLWLGGLLLSIIIYVLEIIYGFKKKKKHNISLSN